MAVLLGHVDAAVVQTHLSRHVAVPQNGRVLPLGVDLQQAAAVLRAYRHVHGGGHARPMHADHNAGLSDELQLLREGQLAQVRCHQVDLHRTKPGGERRVHLLEVEVVAGGPRVAPRVEILVAYYQQNLHTPLGRMLQQSRAAPDMHVPPLVEGTGTHETARQLGEPALPYEEPRGHGLHQQPLHTESLVLEVGAFEDVLHGGGVVVEEGVGLVVKVVAQFERVHVEHVQAARATAHPLHPQHHPHVEDVVQRVRQVSYIVVAEQQQGAVVHVVAAVPGGAGAVEVREGEPHGGLVPISFAVGGKEARLEGLGGRRRALLLLRAGEVDLRIVDGADLVRVVVGEAGHPRLAARAAGVLGQRVAAPVLYVQGPPGGVAGGVGA
mmetsp:Transcript_4433/g.9999  ORF Transcript_4433/g.9999 Transcript_4433/m.9999 type:complete len:382 (-) Transcript_4433:747-1892(-)